MLTKNTASQKVRVFAWDSTTGLPKTGDAANISAYISKDFGAITQLTDTSATEEDSTNAKGYYLFDISQTETNADDIAITAKSSTSNIVVVGAPARIRTVAPNSAALSIDSNGRVDVIKVNGTSQTARDLGASVLLSVGTGTGQVSLSSGKVNALLAASDVTGNVAADLQTIKTQTVMCSGGVTVPAATLASTTNIVSATGVDVTKFGGTNGTFNSGIPSVALADGVTHGGTTAYLLLDSANFTAAGNTPALTLTATSTNQPAALLTGSGSGSGLRSVGGNSSGAGVTFAGGGANGAGFIAQGASSGVGGQFISGANGTIGLKVFAQSSTGKGFVANGGASGADVELTNSLAPTLRDAVWTGGTRQVSDATNITSTGGTTVPQTGDAYARLGAPAGASVSADVAAVKADTAAVKLKTDNLPASPAAVGSAMTLTSGERDSIAAALLDLSNGVETSVTVRQALRLLSAAVGGVLSGAATTTVTIKAAANSGTTRVTATVDSDGNRSALTLNL